MTESKVTNHWGKWVDSEVPITGVFQNNHCEWLHEEMYDAIDLDYETWIAEENPDEEELEMYESMGDSTLLIGSWKKDEQGLYEPDKESGDYAAIMGEVYTQVVWSKYTTRTALCSPCYPGQGDADSEGEYLTYALPPEIIGNLD